MTEKKTPGPPTEFAKRQMDAQGDAENRRTPRRFVKKPVEVSAEQLTWATWNDVCALIGDFDVHCAMDTTTGVLTWMRGVYVHPTDNEDYSDEPKWDDARIGLVIPTLEGVMLAVEGDWVIRGIRGEFYPCKPDIFVDSYEELA